MKTVINVNGLNNFCEILYRNVSSEEAENKKRIQTENKN